MTILVQVCVVVVSIAVVAMAFAAIQVMRQLATTTRKLEISNGYLQDLLADSRETSKKVRELVLSLEQIASTVRSGVTGIAGVVSQATSISGMVLDEVQRPVLQIVALMRALRSGVRGLSRRWTYGRDPVHSLPEGVHHV